MQERQTRQKSIIYDALKTLDHPTATEVYGYVHERHPSVSRATVFRVLGGFAQTGRALELRLQHLPPLSRPLSSLRAGCGRADAR